jgi:ubiquinone/menaquinone biosynthesis C-methylase UbiE
MMFMAQKEKNDPHHFDRWSETYESSWNQWLFDRVQEALLDLAESRTRPKSILDVGCGTGRLLRKARERWPKAKVIGVDSSEGMVRKARQLAPGVKFDVGKAESLPLPDSSVDTAFSTMSFHHWSDQLQGIREVARVLRKGGRFFMADMNMPFGLHNVVQHFGPDDPKKVRKMFAKAGLEVKKQRRWALGFVQATAGEKQ